MLVAKCYLNNTNGKSSLLFSRNISTVVQNKIRRARNKQEKEQKHLQEEASKTSQKKIVTNLSGAEYVEGTKPGSKKDISCPLPTSYSSKFVEACWYPWWEKEGFFEPVRPKEKDKSDIFSMVIPPPNVTGKLHLGHALTVALEDVMCRWNRMQGREVVWVPGCDHAGIATQAVVERLLTKDNVSRQQLGREKFLDEVWKWKEQKEGEIYDQLRVLGASLDWTRTSFTLSPKFSYAVQEAFIRLHEQDVIYRKKSLVNWSCQLQSTISDIEIDNRTINGPTYLHVPGYERKIEFGVLHTFSYPLLNPTSDRTSIDVSTTRIETMLGDTAIAVNPQDQRFTGLIGARVCHPLSSDLTLPIITDLHVDPDFGTGAVKITPAHDFNDFEIGERHGLPSRNILDDCGSIANTGNADFDGLPRFTARRMVIEALDNLGLYRGKHSHDMNLPVCSRSGDVIEPRVKTQWFVRTKDLSAKAMNAVAKGALKIEPDSHLTAWNNWLSNCEDWCISRQLWWGHRVPAYFITNKNGEKKWVAAHSEEEALRKFGDGSVGGMEALRVIQDEDVLDTWFSSALFPFAVFGWPSDNNDLDRYYPLSVMETGYDLLFFWVARMTMLGITLTGKVPFTTVFLHNMVRDSQGRKMSKSLGNVIDPLQVINGCSAEELDARIKSSNLTDKEEKIALKDRRKTLPHGIPECGTDALRFYLCLNKKSGRDISLDVHSVVQYRFFCNKIWNAFKFLEANVQRRPEGAVLEDNQLRPVDLWIRSSLSGTVESCNAALETFNFATAATSLHKFFFVDFADFYLESCKSVFSHPVADMPTVLTAQQNFEFVFDFLLRLLSPFMPFLTEELWQRLPNKDLNAKSVTLTQYPTLKTHDYRNPGLDADINTVRSVIQTIRSARQTFKVAKSVATNVTVFCGEESDNCAVVKNADVISSITKCGNIAFTSFAGAPGGCISYSVPNSSIQVFVELRGVIDVESQRQTLEKRRASVQRTLQGVQEKINAAKKVEVKEKLCEKLQNLKGELEEVECIIRNLDSLR